MFLTFSSVSSGWLQIILVTMTFPITVLKPYFPLLTRILKNSNVQADLLVAQIQKSNTNTQFKIFQNRKETKNYGKGIYINTRTYSGRKNQVKKH